MTAIEEFERAFTSFTNGAHPRDFKDNPVGFASVLNRGPESLRALWATAQDEARRERELREADPGVRRLFEPLGPRGGA